MEAALYDRLLIESSTDDLRLIIDEAPKLFSTKSLASLQAFKYAVDARLTAEPETRAFSMSDPHEIRLRYWRDIADRLQAEISWRSRQANQNASTPAGQNPSRPGAGKEPAVAARRTIVRKNRGIPDEELCEYLDREETRLPKGWHEAGFKTWREAWHSRRRHIHVIFSKDRKVS
jgi:SRSO17 transposase